MAWIFLFVAGLLEIVWAFSMKLSQGFTRLTPSIVTIMAMLASVACLTIAMKQLPLGTAYVIWTGIGAVGAFILGVVYFHDTLTPMRVIFASIIVIGLIGLKFASD